MRRLTIKISRIFAQISSSLKRVRIKVNANPPSNVLQKVTLYFTVVGTILSLGIALYAVYLTRYISEQSVKIEKMDTLLHKEDSLLGSLNSILHETRNENVGLTSLVQSSNEIFKEINKQLIINSKALNIASQQLQLYIKATQFEIRSNYFRLKSIVHRIPFSKSEDIYLGRRELSESAETLL